MRRVIVVFTLILAISLTSGVSFAKDLAGRFGFGGNWFYYLPSEADFDGNDIDNEGTPTAFNIHFSYCLPHPTETININLVLDWEYISRDFTKDESDTISNDLGRLTMIPLMIGTQVRFANLGRITPYFGFNLGVSFNSIKKGDRVDEWEEFYEAQYPGWNFNGEIDTDHSFAFKVPIGVDVFITDNIALNIEGKYFYTSPKVETTSEGFNGLWLDMDTDEINQSTFAFGTGVSFYF